MTDVKLSEKYLAFLRTKAKVEFLEGTTYAGKTTVGIIKFMLKVAQSPKRQHIIAGLDNGTIEKNIINKELGLIDVFGSLCEYFSAGRGSDRLAHIVMHTPDGDKIIYLLGYDNRTRWKKALGGQYGCLYIDEINIADIEFVRETSMRCDYLLATLNPDAPDLPVYSEYINHARPLPQYASDAPEELLEMLNLSPKDGWVWWYFSFDHNAALTQEKRSQIVSAVAPGTKIYKNKILGLRARATGLVFSNFDRAGHLLTASECRSLIRHERRQEEYFDLFSAGLDTSYSSKSSDTIAMSFIGITNKGRCVVLCERVYNNAQMQTPIAPSDTAQGFADFLDRCSAEWGNVRTVFIDCADAATITELGKFKRESGCVYSFTPAWKQTRILDRINLQSGWFAHGDFLVCADCTHYIAELESYSWRDDRDAQPEDAHDHMINSVQYAWLPYKTKIGTGGKEVSTN